MSDKQNPRLEKDDALPAEEQRSPESNGSAPKSYYYDDSTGYEIYEDEDLAKTNDEKPEVKTSPPSAP